MKKAIINLMNPVHRLQQAPRCSATAKRTRQPCRAPAVRGWTVCRCHGARGGAPTGGHDTKVFITHAKGRPMVRRA